MGITRARRLVQKMSGATARHTFDDLKGKHPLFVQALELAKIASSTDSTILILGESGTGKDMIAQAMHNASKRSNGPFVAINCGAIPHSLIESELFGYVEGAFTGARKGGSPGKFELADGGTIFLDEIGDMAMQLQSTLLRVLEQKVIVRVGGTGMWPIDVRVMAATNRDLSREIEAGNFRRDLYYRLNVVSLKIPPLRERRDDILLLANHLLAKLKSFMKRPVVGVDGAAMQVLRNYSWPGNVRELQNVIERVLHLTEGPMIRIEHLPEDLKIA